jgi:hypothetical protein
VRLVEILAVEISVPRDLLPAASTTLGSYSFTSRERGYIDGILGPAIPYYSFTNRERGYTVHLRHKYVDQEHQLHAVEEHNDKIII